MRTPLTPLVMPEMQLSLASWFKCDARAEISVAKPRWKLKSAWSLTAVGRSDSALGDPRVVARCSGRNSSAGQMLHVIVNGAARGFFARDVFVDHGDQTWM